MDTMVYAALSIILLSSHAYAQAETEVGDTISCQSCYVHPDSKEENLAYCDETLIQCPANQGCWVLEKEVYTLRGCMSEMVKQHSGASPQFSEEETTYCTKFWRDGACTKGEMCLSCNNGSENATIEMGILLAIMGIQTLQAIRLL